MKTTPSAFTATHPYCASLLALGVVVAVVTLALMPGQMVEWQGASTHDPHPRALLHVTLAVPAAAHQAGDPAVLETAALSD